MTTHPSPPSPVGGQPTPPSGESTPSAPGDRQPIQRSVAPAVAADWRSVALVALLFAVTVQLLRACGPLLDQVAGPVGIVNAALIALGIFALPGLLLTAACRVRPTTRLGLPTPLLVMGTGLLGVAWGAAAAFGRSLPLVAFGAVVGLVTLALAVRQAGGPVTATVGLLAGGALDLAFRSATVTWDPVWGSVPARTLGTVAVVAAFALAMASSNAVAAGNAAAPAPGGGRSWALGGYLALWTTTLGNPAFAASQSGVALQVCLIVLIGTLAVAVELVRRLTVEGGTNAIPEPDHWIAGSAALAGLAGGLALAWWGGGPVVLLGLVLAQLSAAVAVARALASPSNRGVWAYGLVWVLPVLLFQVHYDMPLPFGNRWLLIVLAVAVGLAGMGRRPLHPGGGWRVDLRGLVARPGPVAGAVALALAVPLLMHLTRPDEGTVTASPQGVTVLSWNVKYGRDDATGQADPRQLAEAVRAVDPDVVVLQEVRRGWASGGGVDVAEYLSRELRMPFWWSPAADGQFGNLLLTRLPVSDVRTGLLPYGQGPMDRSYLKATVHLAFGKSLDVVTAHLTHRKPNTPTRLDQIDTLLAQVDPARPTVVAGDFNFWPSWPETRSFTGAGWVSAQDVTGRGAAWTSPTDRPTNRVDWVFGSPAVSFTDFQVLAQITASDHFPVLATATLPAP